MSARFDELIGIARLRVAHASVKPLVLSVDTDANGEQASDLLLAAAPLPSSRGWRPRASDLPDRHGPGTHEGPQRNRWGP